MASTTSTNKSVGRRKPKKTVKEEIVDPEKQKQIETLIFGNLINSFGLERETSKGDDVTEVKDLHLEKDYESLSGEIEQMGLVKEKVKSVDENEQTSLAEKSDREKSNERWERHLEYKESLKMAKQDVQKYAIGPKQYDRSGVEILTLTAETYFRTRFNPTISWDKSREFLRIHSFRPFKLNILSEQDRSLEITRDRINERNRKEKCKQR